MGDETKQSFLAKLKAAKEIIGAIAVVGGVLAWGGSHLFEEAMEERDASFSELKGSVEAFQEQYAQDMLGLKDRVRKLESAHEETQDAARERFQQNEVVDTEIQGSVTALRGEVRIRHREDPEGYGVSMGTVRLRASAEETDRMLIRAANAQPQNTPLLGL